MRLEIDGPLPPGLPAPGRNEPCGCGSGHKFKKCCWARTIARTSSDRRLLVIGAGATIEECKRSGANPGEPLPSIANFGNQLFNESASLQRVSASYLKSKGIAYDSTMLDGYEGRIKLDPMSDATFQNSPLRVYLRLEAVLPSEHNVERLFEHVWRTYGDNGDLWEALTWDGIFLYLFNAFITQFGL